MGAHKNSAEEIKSVLLDFTKRYEEKNLETLNSFINDFFVNEEDTSFVGSGVNDLFTGTAQIEAALKTYWTDKSKFLSNIELDIDNSAITIEGNTAVVSISGKSSRKIQEEEMYKDMIARLHNNLKHKGNSKEDLLKVSHLISRTFYEVNLGENYIWPFRVTILLVHKDNTWKFKHVKLSFGGCNGWEDWFTDEASANAARNLTIKTQVNPEIEQIQNVLQKFQEGYIKKDFETLESFSKEVFTNDEGMFIFGTDEGENFNGIDAGRNLSELDWKYWGDFDLNRENAFITVHDNMAWVYSKAFLNKIIKVQSTRDSLGELFYEYLLPSESTSKEILNMMLWKTTSRLYDSERGEKYIAPMKFAGVLIKKDNEWRIHHMHFSDFVDRMPEPRL